MKCKNVFVMYILLYTVCIFFLIMFVLGIYFSYKPVNEKNYKSKFYSYVNGNSATKQSPFQFIKSGKKMEFDTKDGYSYETSMFGKNHKNTFIKTYDEFEEFVNQFGKIVTIEDKNILDYFNFDYFSNHTLAVIIYEGIGEEHYSISEVVSNGTEVNIHINHVLDSHVWATAPSIKFLFITLDKDITFSTFYITTKHRDTSYRF